jgi:FkbM family methyltransferase
MTQGSAMKTLLKQLFPRQWMAYSQWRRGYSEPELQWLPKVVRTGGISVDVGANIGEYTRPLSRISNHVHAFEPSGELANLLARAVPRNVTVHNLALSDRSGFATLRTPLDVKRKTFGLASLESLPTHHQVVGEKVRIARLDDVIQQEDIDFVKIDVEGHEMSVLRGATELISRCRPIFLVESEERHRPGATAELFGFFDNLSYAGRFLRDNDICDLTTFNLTHDQAIHDRGRYVYNFFFFPSQGSARRLLDH